MKTYFIDLLSKSRSFNPDLIVKKSRMFGEKMVLINLFLVDFFSVKGGF